jgi:hypothetical protein
MQRREAVALFRDICKCIPDAFVSKISLTPRNDSNKEFELRINVLLEDENFESVQTVVNKHGLNLKEEHESLLIYGGPRLEKLETA